MPPRTNMPNPISESHEERLQQLEERTADIQAKVEGQTVKLDYMHDEIDKGFGTLSDKLDEKFGELKGPLAALDSRLSKIEDVEHKRAVYTSWIKKGLLPIGVVASAFLTRFGQQIFHFIFG